MQRNMGSKRQVFNVSLSKDAVEYNIALVGELGVGKSALTVKYLTKRFIMEYAPNIEDTYRKHESIEGKDVIIKVMDTCDSLEKGAEKYIKWAQGITVVYSITSRNTFDTAKKCLEQISQFEKVSRREIAVVLVANKVDLECYRTVSTSEGRVLASEYDCMFYETSAAEDYGSVQQIFQDMAREIARSNERNASLQTLFISEDSKASFNQMPQGRTFRRTKSPGSTHDVKDTNRSTDKDGRFPQKRTPSTFKILKSRFNIFN